MFVRDVVMRRNVARGGSASDSGGGALYNDGGTLRVRESLLAKNRAPAEIGSGGGILNNQGTLVVRASDVVENVSTRAGGGIETNAGDVTLVNVDLLRNRTAANPGNSGGCTPPTRASSTTPEDRPRRTSRPPRVAVCGTPPPAP